ncbi:hypothetical protein L484_007403 [Morus notabilis]|uniref:Uncharacterized protein n=1 Tax=Morus notabilis TaxID=981085 RepID=W9QJP3_9ROSA|nr:hypothetical protein L484_007403 [Morus notabilis]
MNKNIETEVTSHVTGQKDEPIPLWAGTHRVEAEEDAVCHVINIGPTLSPTLHYRHHLYLTPL